MRTSRATSHNALSRSNIALVAMPVHNYRAAVDDRGRRGMQTLLAFLCLLLLAYSSASAQQVSFAGKPVSMVIGYPGGGGTDLVEQGYRQVLHALHEMRLGLLGFADGKR